MSKLDDLLGLFAEYPDQAERTQLLLDYADKFKDVPAAVATRPFDRAALVPHCESEAYVWAVPNADGTLKLHFAVENPSGISAKALAVILDRSLSGLPAEEVAKVDPDVVEKIFRQNISMGKGMGLMSMVQRVQALARRALQEKTS
ncbi:MAG: SufE family protein [Acidobacteriota bacterium]|nr:SufE family protein [Acidobacteriota bacterium]